VVRQLKAKDTAYKYGWLYRAAVEAVSWVRYVYGPAEYALLGSPELLFSIASGGAPGLAKKVGTDVAFGLAETALRHPSRAARRTAGWAYREGLAAYRENRQIFEQYRDAPDSIPASTAATFFRNTFREEVMQFAKNLYNDITAHKRGKGKYADTPRAKVMEVESALGKIGASAGSGALDSAALWMRVMRTLSESGVGLPSYPPYQRYERDARRQWQAYEDALKRLRAKKPGKDQSPSNTSDAPPPMTEGGVPMLSDHASNPVRITGGSLVFKDANEYKLYYVEVPKGYGLNLATSPDGTRWRDTANQVISKRQSGVNFCYTAAILKEGGTYRAWYSATGDWCIAWTDLHLATSRDGRSWTEVGTVLRHGELGTYDSRNINSPSIVHDGSTYHMYYDATATRGGDQCPPETRWSAGIAYATSPDGRSWTKHGIVLAKGAPGDADAKSVGKPSAIHTKAGFELFYNGADGSRTRVMYATSADGKNWKRHGPVSLSHGKNQGVITAIREGSRYELFYSCDGEMCYAASPKR